MKKWNLLSIAGLSFLFLACARAEEKAFVEGVWKPRAMAKDKLWRERATKGEDETAWKISPSALRLNHPAGEPFDYEIVREEPLPDGDWTLDFALVYRNRAANALNVTFFCGTPGEEFTLRLEHGPNDSPDASLWKAGEENPLRYRSASDGFNGPVLWVKMVYSPRQSRMAIHVNGIPTLLEKTAFALIPRGPVGFHVSSSYRTDKESAMEIAAFKLENSVAWEPDSIPGSAFTGWPQTARVSWAAPLREQIKARALAAIETPGADANTRANAMAALLMSERASTGKVSDESWQQLVGFINKNIDLDLPALSRLLPLAIAACDVEQNPARRDKAEVWTRRVFEGLPAPHQNRVDTPAILQRLALLDPARVADAATEKRLPLRATRFLAKDLQQAAPLKAFAVYRSAGASFPDAAAWLMPEMTALSPLWGRVMGERLRAMTDEKSIESGQPDRALAVAAYRMASAYPASAMEFAALILKPEVKAEAWEAMSGVLQTGAAPSAEVDRAVVAALEAAVLAWKPSEKDDSSAPQKIRLAQWHMARGRRADATRILNEAQTQMGKLPRTRFRDSWAMARALLRPGWKKLLKPQSLSTGTATNSAAACISAQVFWWWAD